MRHRNFASARSYRDQDLFGQKKLTESPLIDADFRLEVLRGLSETPKTLPCRFLYDERGSNFFELITELPEYYPTRTEIALLKSHGDDIAELVSEGATVVEFGSGASRKTELLLRKLRAPRAYIPIEISPTALFPAAKRIQQNFPDLAVYPILGEFNRLNGLKLPRVKGFKLGFFPGSTIGNMTYSEARAFLRNVRAFLGESAGFLIGVDLKKPLDILLPAYNDSAGVTAQFNLNMLERINRELGGNFDLKAFAHEAIYCSNEGRIEMHLKALHATEAEICGHTFMFRKGETIHTENSHKYSIQDFKTLASEGGWQSGHVWTDPKELFSVHLLA